METPNNFDKPTDSGNGVFNKIKKIVGIGTLAAAGAIASAPVQAQQFNDGNSTGYENSKTISLDEKYSVVPPALKEKSGTGNPEADQNYPTPEAVKNPDSWNTSSSGFKLTEDNSAKEMEKYTYDEMARTTLVDGKKIKDMESYTSGEENSAGYSASTPDFKALTDSAKELNDSAKEMEKYTYDEMARTTLVDGKKIDDIDKKKTQ